MRFVNGLDVGCAREERNIIPKYCPEQLGKWYCFGDRQHFWRRELREKMVGISRCI